MGHSISSITLSSLNALNSLMGCDRQAQSPVISEGHFQWHTVGGLGVGVGRKARITPSGLMRVLAIEKWLA